MINASSSFISAIGGNARTLDMKLFNGSDEIECSIVSASFTKGSCGAEAFQVGGLFSQFAQIIVDELNTNLKGEEIALKIGVLIPSGTYEYIQIGKFKVMNAPRKVYAGGYRSTLECRGRLSWAFDVPFSISVSQSISNVLSRIAAITGVTIQSSAFATAQLSKVITKDLNGLSCKEVLSIVATLLGGYATEDSGDNIVIKKYSSSSVLTISGEDPEVAEDEFGITGVKVIVNEASESEGEDDPEIPEESYEEGVVNLEIVNQYCTEAIFEGMADNLIGFEYLPATALIAVADPRLEPWDSVTFNVTGVDGTVLDTYTIPCMNLVYMYDGGLSLTLTAPGEIVSESNEFISPMMKQVQSVSMAIDVLNAQVASRATVEQLGIATEAAEGALEAANTAQEAADNAEIAAATAQSAADAAIKASYKKYARISMSDLVINSQCKIGDYHTWTRSSDLDYYQDAVKKGDILVIYIVRTNQQNSVAELLVRVENDTPAGQPVYGCNIRYEDVNAYFWYDNDGAHIAKQNGYRTDLGGDSLIIRKGVSASPVASFSESEIVLGNSGENTIYLNATGFEIGKKRNGNIWEEFAIQPKVTTEGVLYPVLGMNDDYGDAANINDRHFFLGLRNEESDEFTERDFITGGKNDDIGHYLTLSSYGEINIAAAGPSSTSYINIDGELYANEYAKFNDRVDFEISPRIHGLQLHHYVKRNATVISNSNVGGSDKYKDYSIDLNDYFDLTDYSALCVAGWHITGTGRSWITVYDCYISDDTLHIGLRNHSSGNVSINMTVHVWCSSVE